MRRRLVQHNHKCPACSTKIMCLLFGCLFQHYKLCYFCRDKIMAQKEAS